MPARHDIIALLRSHALTRRPHHVGGFSLIELIALIVILGILAGAAVPAMYGFANRNASAAMNQLRSDMSFARQRALATGRTTWVRVHAGVNQWSLYEDDPDQPGPTNAVPIIDPSTGVAMATALGAETFAMVEILHVQFNGGSDVGFDWRGRPLDSTGNELTSTGTIRLTGDRQVLVEPSTGSIKSVTPSS